MSDFVISEGALDALREQLAEGMSEKRYRHTCEVEKMAVRLGALYAPEQIALLRAAALLHDLTKEYGTEEHLTLLEQMGQSVSDMDRFAPKTLHAKTAALLIPSLYPDFAHPTVLSCVRWHTTGRAGMSLCEKLIYLADYIDMSRRFEDCVRLRTLFFSAMPESMTESERLRHLDEILILSFDMTMAGLLTDGTPISEDTGAARNALVVARAKRG